MIQTVEQLKQQRPDLVKLFESMDREQLLEQIYKESLDAINMEERVSAFMENATLGMSKTTYPPHVISQLVQHKYERDISDFCKMALEDIEGMSAEEIKQYLKDEIRN